MSTECSVDGCAKAAKGRGMCQAHYRRWQRGTDLSYPIREHVKVCIVPDCGRKTSSKGLCGAHLYRAAKGLSLDAPLRPRQKSPCIVTCTHPDCGKPHKAKGLCETHLWRLKRGKPLDPPIRRKDRTHCSRPGCDRPHAAKDLCLLHYERQAAGTALDAPLRPSYGDATCRHAGCQAPVRARHLCAIHYRWTPAQKSRQDAYYISNRTSIRERNKRYFRQNREVFKRRAHIRRTRLELTGGSYTQADWEAILDCYGHRCRMCADPGPMTVDHIIPVSKGGSSHPWNLAPLCKFCNSKKHNKIVPYL